MHASQFRIAAKIGGQTAKLLSRAGQQHASLLQAAVVLEDPSVGLSVQIERIGADIEDATITLHGQLFEKLPHPLHGQPVTWGSYRIVLSEDLFWEFDLGVMLVADDGTPAVIKLEARIHHEDPELLERINRLPSVIIEFPEGGQAYGEKGRELLYSHLRGDVVIELFLCSDADVLNKLGFHEPVESWFHH